MPLIMLLSFTLQQLFEGPYSQYAGSETWDTAAHLSGMSWPEKNNMKTFGLIYGVLKNLKAQEMYSINLRKPLQHLFLKK